jgi:hypothetical protein
VNDNRLLAQVRLNQSQAAAVLAVMRHVAASGGTISEAAKRALDGAAVHVLHTQPMNDDDLLLPTPSDLAALLTSSVERRFAAQLTAVMALVDGAIDAAKIDRALAFAAALGVEDDYLVDLAETAQGHIEWIVADMSRKNASSIAGLDITADFERQFWPYNRNPDPSLAARFHALGALPYATFGRAFYDQYQQNSYPFPGEHGALSILFGVPHDSAHVLSGYGTSAQGELLVSTFTAAMHRIEGMAGHILPVIYSWHLGIEFNPLAGSSVGAFDGDKFWRAWNEALP